MAEIAVLMTVFLHGDERPNVEWIDRGGVDEVKVSIVDREGVGGELVNIHWDSRLAFLAFIQQLARAYDERYGIKPPVAAAGVNEDQGDVEQLVDERARLTYGAGR